MCKLITASSTNGYVVYTLAAWAPLHSSQFFSARRRRYASAMASDCAAAGAGACAEEAAAPAELDGVCAEDDCAPGEGGSVCRRKAIRPMFSHTDSY